MCAESAPRPAPDTQARRLDRTERRLGVLSRLIEVAKTINSSLDKREVVGHIIRASKEVMNADTASLMLLDRERRELVFEVALGEAGGALKKGKVRIPLGEGIAGWVAQSGEALRFDDVYDDPRFSRKYDEMTGYRTRSMLCVPLKVGEQVVGVAQVINKMGDGGAVPFSDDDTETFTTFCGLAAVAVDKARLHEELLEKQKLEKELELARTIQQSFLTQDYPHPERLRFTGRNVPARKVGGDFYDIFEFGQDRPRIGVTIGDVSGKGVFAALYMARFMSDFRFLAELTPTPVEAIGRANRLLAARSTHGMFITLFYAEYDPATGRFSLVNAGHQPALRYDRERRGFAPAGERGGPPLGILEDAAYEQEELRLAAGEGLVLYTDGVTDARDAEGRAFGFERLVERARASRGELADDLLADVQAFIGRAPQHDDITLVTIEAP